MDDDFIMIDVVCYSEKEASSLCFGFGVDKQEYNLTEGIIIEVFDGILFFLPSAAV